MFKVITKIQGLDALLAKLDALKGSKKTAILRKATAKGAKTVLEAAKANLRGLGLTRKNSLLLQSLGSKVVVGKKGGVYAVVGPRTGFKRTRAGRVQTKLGGKFSQAGVSPVRYAHLVEKGRRGVVPVNRKMLSWLADDGTIVWARSARPVAPRPFLNPALERNKDRVTAAMAEEMATGLSKLAKG